MNNGTQNSKYQDAIVRDVQDPKYENHQKWFWRIYFFFVIALSGIHFYFFQPSLLRNAKILRSLYLASIVSRNEQFKTIVFIYEYVLAFLLFLILVGIFSFIGFFAYDMQQRNRLIQRLLDRDTASALKKEIS